MRRGKDVDTKDSKHERRPPSASSSSSTGIGSNRRSLLQFRHWHVYDNKGSYRGWFDWIPENQRVGHWSPFLVVACLLLFGSLFWYKPEPLIFSPVVAASSSPDNNSSLSSDLLSWSWCADAAIFVWGIVVLENACSGRRLPGALFHGISRSEWASACYLSFTGWSWNILTARAGLEALAPLLGRGNNNNAARTLVASLGSSLRLPSFVGAAITFAIFNFVLLPLIYFGLSNQPKQRKEILRFCFNFFMVNVHVLNLPLATVNVVVERGRHPRLFTPSDLWAAYAIAALYALLYLFVLDRMGMPVYPMFCPRAWWSSISIIIVLCSYYGIMLGGNYFIEYMNPGSVIKM